MHNQGPKKISTYHIQTREMVYTLWKTISKSVETWQKTIYPIGKKGNLLEVDFQDKIQGSASTCAMPR